MDGGSRSRGDWQERVDAVYGAMGDSDPEGLVAQIARLVAELPEGDPVGLFELAGAYDHTEQEAAAEPLYHQALDAGLPSPQRRMAVIQLASTLRNLGETARSVELLKAELDREPEDEKTAALRGETAAFLVLALVGLGREREAAGVALNALLPHLRRYQRPLKDYAADLFGG